MKIEIKNRFTGKVLFEHECDANLSDADLRGADLSYANLSCSDLSDANLSDADLSYANLSCSDLSYANLSYANLSDANLSDADLRGADLSGAVGNSREVMSAQVCSYSIVYTSEFMWIGCRKHPIKTWWKDSEEDAHTFSESDKEWRAKNKRWIQGMVKNNPATKLEVK